MKRFKKMGGCLLLLWFVITGCQGIQDKPIQQHTLIVEDTNNIDAKKLHRYEIDVVFIPEEARIQASQRVRYNNHEKVSLEEIYFHLYPNSFRKEETAPFLLDDFQRAYPKGFQPGYIDIRKVFVNEQPAKYQLEGEGQGVMKIVLPNAMKPGEHVTIEMDYDVKLPPAAERFGYGENTFNFGNWYPIAAVYDDTGWNLDPYYPIGDPFYSDVSNYHVRIDMPKDFVVAASGNILKQEVKNDRSIWEIEAKFMRDFAWVTSKNFEILEKDVDGTQLKMYFIEEETLDKEVKEWAVNAAENALKLFNRVYGQYPYGQYSVVATNFPSGMEYPGIVFIGKQYYDVDWRDYLEIVIVHETAHQWWYGIVGNDEIDEAWLDESLATYSEVIYARELFGEDVAENYHQSVNEEAYKEIAGNIGNKAILKSLDGFEGWEDYGVLVYSRGAMFLDALYEKYGQEIFYQIMQGYYQKYRFKNATTKDFQRVCEDITGEGQEGFFQQWLWAK